MKNWIQFSVEPTIFEPRLKFFKFGLKIIKLTGWKYIFVYLHSFFQKYFIMVNLTSPGTLCVLNFRVFFWLNWCIFKNYKFRHVFCQNLSSFIGNKPTDKQSLYLYKRHKEPYLSYNPKHPRLANCFVSVSSRVKKSVPELLNRDIITLNPKPTW